MNLQVNHMTVFPNTGAREGDRNYLDLNVSMSRPQIERAIVTLLGRLTDQEAQHLLREEFPELFTTEESTQ
jgi:hypothetical protein